MKFTSKGKVFVANVYFDIGKNMARSETEFDDGKVEAKHHTSTQAGWDYCKELLGRGWEEVDIARQENVEADITVAEKLVVFLEEQIDKFEKIVTELESLNVDAQPSKDLLMQFKQRRDYVQEHIPKMKSLKRQLIHKVNDE